MLRSGGIGAVKVYILMAEEATVLVLCVDFICRDCVARIAHSLLNVCVEILYNLNIVGRYNLTL